MVATVAAYISPALEDAVVKLLGVLLIQKHVDPQRLVW